MGGARPGATAQEVLTRRSRHHLTIAAALLLIALGVTALLAFASPATTARAFGFAPEIPATVVGVTFADEQPDGRDALPHWAVTLSWTDPSDGSRRTGTTTVRAVDAPYRERDTTGVFVLGDDFSVDDEAPPGIWIGVGGVLLLLGAASVVAGRARPWKQLGGAMGREPALRVRITAFSAAAGRQWRPLIDYTPVAGDAPDAVLRLYPQPPFVHPRVGDEFELWPLRADGRGPVLMRRRSDGVWWAGLYRPRLEPVDP